MLKKLISGLWKTPTIKTAPSFHGNSVFIDNASNPP
jgi:hypothetical protein